MSACTIRLVENVSPYPFSDVYQSAQAVGPRERVHACVCVYIYIYIYIYVYLLYTFLYIDR